MTEHYVAQRWAKVQGDQGETAIVRIDGVDSLTGVTAVEAHVWPINGLPPGDTLTGSLLSAVDRTVTINFGSWLTTATPGTYFVEVQCTAPGKVFTSPERAADLPQLTVRAQGG